MADAFSRNVVIQILISIPLIILGMVAVYLIYRARSEPMQAISYDLSDEPESMEETPDEDDERYIKEVPERDHSPKPTQVKPKDRDLVKYPADLVKRLEKLRYDGYMQIGKAKLAWLSDEKSRTAVRAGETLDGNIRIDKIHENFLLVSVSDGHTTRKIPFTLSSDEKNSMTSLSPSVIARNTGQSSFTSTQSAASTQKTAVNRRSGGNNMGPSRYGPPSIPGGMSPPVMRMDERKDIQNSNNTGTVIRIDPELKTVISADETFAVKVKIDNGSNVFAVPFDINYDPDMLEVIGVYEGPYLKKDGGQTTFLTSIDKDKGKISIGLVRLGQIGGVSGSGTLASIAFRALKNGTTLLSFANGKPMDSGLDVLPARFVRGKVEMR